MEKRVCWREVGKYEEGVDSVEGETVIQVWNLWNLILGGAGA